MDRINIWRREDGASGIIMAVSFTMIIAVCALVVDLGLAYIRGSSLQNAADAAAYAAAELLPADVSDTSASANARQIVDEYIEKNGQPADSVLSVELGDVINSQYTSVQVELTRQVDYSFAPVFGTDGTSVTKNAKVRMEPVVSTIGVVPLGVEKTALVQALAANQGKDIPIKFATGDNGFFGALDLDSVVSGNSGGANDFSDWLAYGYDGMIDAGDIPMYVEPGNMSGPTSAAFTIRYNQCNHYSSLGGCNSDHFCEDCPRVILVIVYSQYGSKTVKVQGFVPMVLEGMDASGQIYASCITLEADSGETQPDGNYYGLYRLRLVE